MDDVVAKEEVLELVTRTKKNDKYRGFFYKRG